MQTQQRDSIVAGTYVNQVLASQDFFASHMEFPRDEFAVLTDQDYAVYYSLLSAQLSERKHRTATLTLTRGNEALPSLLAYLKTKPPLFFNELVLKLIAPLTPELQEQLTAVLTALSAAGLPALKLVDPTQKLLSANAAEQLAAFVNQQKIVTEVELPLGNPKAQQALDECVSVHQRAHRIERFGKKAALLDVKVGDDKLEQAKRVRKKLPQHNLGIDIEVQTEAAIEISAQPSVTDPAEDKSEKEFVDRGEFVSLAKNKHFKLTAEQVEQLAGHEKRTWDHWLGNISQHRVGPVTGSADKWKGVKIYDATALPEDEKSIASLKLSCPIKFQEAEVSTYVYANPPYERLTMAACEKLLQYQAQFQFGVDFQHLPVGFECLEVEIGGGKKALALDYSASRARMSKNDPLAIQLYTAPEAQPLSQDLCSQWEALLPKKGADLWLLNQYRALLAQGYSRQEIAQFKQYLPVLLEMPEAVLQTAGGIEALIKVAKQHQKALAQTPANFTTHLLLKLLKNESALVDALKVWHKKLNLTTAGLNGLLTVYDAYGSKGLSALFKTWEKIDLDILQHLQAHFFSSLTTYLPLLDTRFEDAVNILSHLNPKERLWWKALFAQHAAAVGPDDLLTLVKSFQAFLEKIKEKNLSLYENCQFQGIKSLPVALSRILEILNKTSPDDLAGVWARVTELDLQSNGAIRVITGAQSKAGSGQLVIPEMQVRPEFYYHYHDDSLAHKTEKPRQGYQAIRVTHLDPNRTKTTLDKMLIEPESPENLQHLVSHSIDQVELERNYYRFIAAQEYRLSLRFYQQAAGIIEEKFADKSGKDCSALRKKMYGLIVAATSGFEGVSQLHDEATSLQEVKVLCDRLNLITVPAILPYPSHLVRTACLDEMFLRSLDPMAPLPYLKRLMEAACQGFNISSFSLFSLATITDKITEFKYFIARLEGLVKKYKYAFYEGTKYVEEEKAGIEKLFEYAALAEGIAPESKIKGAMISLMSTFDLKNDFCELTPEIESGKVKPVADTLYVKPGNKSFSYFTAAMSKPQTVPEGELLTLVPSGAAGLLSVEHMRSSRHRIWEYVHLKGRISSKCSRIASRSDLFEKGGARFLDAAYSGLHLLKKMKTKISPKTRKPLIEADLTLFLEELQRRVVAKTAVDVDQLTAEVVKERFSEYFEVGFFEQLQETQLSNEEERLIGAEFALVSEQCLVKKIILSFKHISDRMQRVDSIPNLARVCKKIPGAERAQFLTDLSTLNNAGDNSLEELNALISEIGHCGSIDDFNYLLACGKQNATLGLVAKMSIFYQQAVPYLRNNVYKKLSLPELQPLAARLVLSAGENSLRFNQFFDKSMKSFSQVVNICPEEKHALLSLFSSFLDKTQQKPKDFCAAVEKFLSIIHKTTGFHKADFICSLCGHFQNDPEELVFILAALDGLSVANQKFILKVLTALLNNGKPYKQREFEEFLRLCKDSPRFMTAVKEFFKEPPYPSFEEIFAWHKKHRDERSEGIYQTQMLAEYQAYHLKPCEREAENGFKLVEARYLNRDFQGLRFEDAELEKLAAETEAVKTIETSKLKAELATFKAMTAEQRAAANPRLLAIVAELLYRSKGSNGGQGRSFELNAVQYLAVLAFLKSKGHVTSQIATGEGKSRVMMIAAASAFALGKTVDFVTSSLPLAQRDYLEYQAFFKILGAKTSIISSTSPVEVYQKNAIHFSDAANLSLFRNQAKTNGQGDKVIDPDPSQRALLLDEADRTYFDLSETRFNYSQAANENIKDMEWIYPMAVRFFNQKDAAKNKQVRALFEQDMDACNKAFIEFLKAQPEYTDDMLERMQALTLGQLEAWQEAAITAIDMVLGQDFTLEPNVLIGTAKGSKVVSEARLIYGHHLARNSKFSFGVHQCLHAYLNDELKNPESATSQKCAELLMKRGLPKATLVQAFFIHPEKEIVYSTTSKSLLDDYNEGEFWAVTGTAGKLRERQEGAVLYGKNQGFEQPMKFITVPRKLGLLRVDRSLHLTGDFQQKIAALWEYIIEARKAGRPTLVVCEDDKEAALINAALGEYQKKQPPLNLPGRWQFIDSQSSAAEEKDAILQAGKAGAVTITTRRMGRGTDIRLSEAAKKAGGLRVLSTFLPSWRDLMQIFGRGGRYGDPGDARLVVDQEQMKRHFGQKKLNVDFFLANESYVQIQQSRVEHQQQAERLIRNALSDFRMKITDTFFNYFDSLKNVTEKQRNEKLLVWSGFTKKIDQLWNQAWPDLVSLISQSPVDMHQVKVRLTQFKVVAQAEWHNLRLDPKMKEDNALLPEKLSHLQLDSRTEHLLRIMMPKRQYTLADRTQVYQTYEKSLDGRAAIYTELFAEWKAIWRGERQLFANMRAWWNGRGILFANTRAWWAGKRPLFANLRVWMNKNQNIAEQAWTPEPIKNEHILEALKSNEPAVVKRIVQEMDTVEFLEPQKGDVLLSFKIQLVEAVLDFAHHRLTEGAEITKKDMEDMYNILSFVKGQQKTQEQLVMGMTEKLQHTTVRFFGRSMRQEIDKIIEQRKKEAEAEQQLIRAGEPGWDDYAPAA